jgi:hypothetical protein
MDPKLRNITDENMIHQSKKLTRTILSKWLGKINKLFHDIIWKNRNDNMIEWEISQGITKDHKKKKPAHRRPASKNTIRKSHRTENSGKYEPPPDILLHKEWYNNVKLLMGYNSKDKQDFYSEGDMISVINYIYRLIYLFYSLFSFLYFFLLYI